MSALKETNIRLPEELVDRVRDKVRSGRYESESDVIAESLAALDDRDAELDDWLREQVLPAIEEWEKDPSLAIPMEEAFAWLDAQMDAHEKSLKS